ncbi:hypothetical protein ACOME3_003499 [Neoechinorhynchus agilis]
MVSFSCGSCGETLKKKQVDGHLGRLKCRKSTLSCIGCGKEFTDNDYKLHCECLKEEQKYGPLNRNSKIEMSKNQQKQSNWFGIVSRAVNMAEESAPYVNFVRNSIRGYSMADIEKCWNFIEDAARTPQIPEGKSALENKVETVFGPGDNEEDGKNVDLVNGQNGGVETVKKKSTRKLMKEIVFDILQKKPKLRGKLDKLKVKAVKGYVKKTGESFDEENNARLDLWIERWIVD